MNKKDEFNRWQAIKLSCDKKVTNPIKYRKEIQDLWPRLARMAFDMFGIQTQNQMWKGHSVMVVT
jgi:hypothetical protein